MAVLNPKPGSSTPKQRCLLHRIKRKMGWSDDQLHEALGFDSTKDMSAQEASDAIERLGDIGLPNPPGKAPNPYAKKRSDAVRMITDFHIRRIARLGLAHFEDPVVFRTWLTKNFKLSFVEPASFGDVDGLIRQLGTAERAGQIIRVLKEMIQRRNIKESQP